MNKSVAVFGSVVVLGIIAIAFLLVTAQRERELQSRERQQLNGAIQSLQAQVSALTASNAAAQLMVSAAEARANGFRALAETNAAALSALTNRLASSNAVTLKPYQVRSFVGTQYVGMAWFIQSNQRRDPKTGLISYDPVVSLPEQSRRMLTSYVTNVVEKPVAAEPQYVEQNNYYDQRSYDNTPWWSYPATIVPPPAWPARPAEPAIPDRPWRPAQPVNPIAPGGILRPPDINSPGILRPPDANSPGILRPR